MVALDHAVQTLQGAYPTDLTPDSVIDFVAGQVGSGDNTFTNSTGTILCMKNSGSSQRTVTITSVADPTYHRTGDIVITLENGEECMFKFPSTTGWVTSGKTTFAVSHAEVLIAVVK